MIKCFTQLSCFDEGYNLLADHYRLRYQSLRKLEWKVLFDNDKKLEWDEYDTPSTVYFSYYDSLNDTLLASMRLCRTDIVYPQRFQTPSEAKTGITCMLNDHFSDALEFKANKSSPHRISHFLTKEYREGSRLCVSTELTSKGNTSERRQAISYLILGVVEYLSHNSIKGVIGIMPIKVWNSVWKDNEFPAEWLGDPYGINGSNEKDYRAGINFFSQEKLSRLRIKLGIKESVLDGVC